MGYFGMKHEFYRFLFIGGHDIESGELRRFGVEFPKLNKIYKII